MLPEIAYIAPMLDISEKANPPALVRWRVFLDERGAYPHGEGHRLGSQARHVDGEDLAVAHQHLAVHDDADDILLIGDVNEVRDQVVEGCEMQVFERHLDQVGTATNGQGA